MVKCYVHGTMVTMAATNSHHITPKGAGGQDGGTNEVRICTNCHSILHRAEEMLSHGRANLVDSLVSASFEETGQRKRMKHLIKDAATAFLNADESGFSKDEAQIVISRETMEKLQVLAQGVKDPVTKRLVGASRYADNVLRQHIRSKGIQIGSIGSVKGR